MTMERLFSGIMALFSLFLAYLAIGYVAPIAYDPIGPRPYPILIFSLLAALTLVIAFRPARFTKVINLGYDNTVIKNLILCVTALAVYSLIFEPLGFVISTMLMCFTVGLLFAGKPIKSLIFSVVISIALYVLFDMVLDVILPLGLLSGIMG
ncbi:MULTISPECIES: tripartite tricarboxylate transporter TctB family protein [unclassified Psychrobacter]|uniref:tripartite tricarboxylate transporter TctB family protein n=1 Tax=unclassified Psychrobacter TaxID=196806 RepID=UPI001787D045|nr:MULTISPECIES: tripartite tricarboxylate transporter TctB family protein [unclassified Psychrobacter]MBE0442698.1 tripartite tricarboxylate transporter TctB family protein [Psychrobacter sp. FME13]